MQIEVETELPSLALAILKQIVAQCPQPQAKTDAARMAAQAIGNHLIFLIKTASDANVKGRHSVAVSLFRNMEDALDCFAAVALSPGAAERWFAGELKASQAAKIYKEKVGPHRLSDGSITTEYRKTLRSFFNNFAHCTPLLIEWDFFPYFENRTIRQLVDHQLDGSVNAELRVNTQGDLLVQNGIRIGAFLIAHALEFLQMVSLAYEYVLSTDEDLRIRVINISDRLSNFLKCNWTAVYLETPPPEIKTPRIQHPDNPLLVMDLPLQEKEAGDRRNGCQNKP
ncbi:MAG: hypothetical protein P9C48_01210 [Defluviicoccus sp.]|nr:hypothetical protein [Defluviicoccus sp.]MDG4607731.1 hypothetical protein [Defluviicoccus sp.]